MIDLILLLWHFLVSQPPARVVDLLSWHLLALLAMLALLSSFGIHFLMGYVAGFYRRRDRIARWVSIPSLLLLLISGQLLLGAYLLGVHGARLVSLNQTDSVLRTLGEYLLEPAFDTPALAGISGTEIPKRRLRAAFKASTENRYREALAKNIVTPEQLTAFPQPGGETGNRAASSLAERILVQVGMRWITAPHETWWAPLNPGAPENTGKTENSRAKAPDKTAGKDDGDEVFFLPVFLQGLIGELAEDDKLSRANWEHVAGTRFAEGYLLPVMREYLTFTAVALALAVLLIDLLFFLALGRIKRIGLSKGKEAGQQLPAVAESSIPAESKGNQKNSGDNEEKSAAKSLPGPGVKSGKKTAGKKNAGGKHPEAPQEISEEISAAFPQTAPPAGSPVPPEPDVALPPDAGAAALPPSSGAGTSQVAPPLLSADPEAAGNTLEETHEETPGELLLGKERKIPEPAEIVKK